MFLSRNKKNMWIPRLSVARVLSRILKIGVKCCRPEKVGVLPYFSIETFQKVGVRNVKLE